MPNVTFDDLGLSPDTLRAVHESGYNTPTPIQAQAIPDRAERPRRPRHRPDRHRQDRRLRAADDRHPVRGTRHARACRARLILEPTRELAAQVAEAFDKYGKYHKLTKALLIGGVSFGDQDALLARGVDVLIATPGRLLDHFERGKLLLTGVQVMVVDEADRMLDMGFIPDIERIFKLTPFTRQTLFFSATMPPEITRLTEQFLSSAEAHRSLEARHCRDHHRPAHHPAAGRRSAHAPRRAARRHDRAPTSATASSSATARPTSMSSRNR